MVHLLDTLAWMKTKDARKKFPQNRPKPFIPDFMQVVPKGEMEVLTTDDIDTILAMPRRPNE